MSEARLREELAKSKTELARLRERMSMGMPTMHKDLSPSSQSGRVWRMPPNSKNSYIVLTGSKNREVG